MKEDRFIYEEEEEQNINPSKHCTDETSLSRGNVSSPGVQYRENAGDLSPFLSTRKTYMQRTFGPMKQGSVRGSMFALCAVAIGAGVLSLPYVLAQTGWILGTVLILVGAVSGYFSMYMILVRSIETKSKNFSELAKLAGGKPLTILLQISILSFMFGACVSY